MTPTRLRAVAIALLAACSGGSGGTPTSRIQVGMSADLVDTLFELHVSLRESDEAIEPYILAGDEELVATLDGESHVLQRGEFDNAISFRIGSPLTEDMPLVVALHRPTDTDALSSQVLVPATHTVSATDPTPLSQDITFTWTPSGSDAELAWDVDGACATGNGPVRSDPGGITIPANALTTGSGPCSGTVTVVKQRSGTVDPHFSFGTISVRHRQRTSVNFVP